MRGLSFFINDELYAADVTRVAKIVRHLSVTPVPAAREAVLGIANLKGKVVTVLDPRALLAAPGEAVQRNNPVGSVKAVVFKPFSENGDPIGLRIDRQGGLISVDDENILPPPVADGAGIVAGVAELEGRLYRILDVNHIINRKEGTDRDERF
ncbi:MAG: chemotaxis protein CheW [Clostridiales bacterium]|jgi:purine-binding chemotaxis protein CheW|nr:chemotaxis protein CheW [Clostridiales bacterium]